MAKIENDIFDPLGGEIVEIYGPGEKEANEILFYLNDLKRSPRLESTGSFDIKALLHGYELAIDQVKQYVESNFK